MASGQDKIFGGLLSLISLLVIIGWLYVMWGIEDVLKTWQWLGIKAFATVAVVVIMIIVFWVGYTISSTPSIAELEQVSKRRRK